MSYDKSFSPVGWYLGVYLLRFVELADKDRNDPEQRFQSWENTVIVKAQSLDVAYTKVDRIAKADAKPYWNSTKPPARVRWEYVGITDLLPLHEELADGAEICWVSRAPRKLKTLRELVKSKGAFLQQAEWKSLLEMR